MDIYSLYITFQQHIDMILNVITSKFVSLNHIPRKCEVIGSEYNNAYFGGFLFCCFSLMLSSDCENSFQYKRMYYCSIKWFFVKEDFYLHNTLAFTGITNGQLVN